MQSPYDVLVGVETLNEGYTPGTYQVSAQFDSREGTHHRTNEGVYADMVSLWQMTGSIHLEPILCKCGSVVETALMTSMVLFFLMGKVPSRLPAQQRGWTTMSKVAPLWSLCDVAVALYPNKLSALVPGKNV